jgi:hypothetical protein
MRVGWRGEWKDSIILGNPTTSYFHVYMQKNMNGSLSLSLIIDYFLAWGMGHTKGEAFLEAMGEHYHSISMIENK